jgi:hypothetical protein
VQIPRHQHKKDPEVVPSQDAYHLFPRQGHFLLRLRQQRRTFPRASVSGPALLHQKKWPEGNLRKSGKNVDGSAEGSPMTCGRLVSCVQKSLEGDKKGENAEGSAGEAQWHVAGSKVCSKDRPKEREPHNSSAVTDVHLKAKQSFFEVKSMVQSLVLDFGFSPNPWVVCKPVASTDDLDEHSTHLHVAVIFFFRKRDVTLLRLSVLN